MSAPPPESEVFSEPGFLDAFRAGRPDTLARVYRVFAPRVLDELLRGIWIRRDQEPIRLVLRPLDADAVVQETFLCLLKWLRTYDPQFSFRTWLWTVLLNQCTRHAQKQARQVAAPIDACGEDVAGVSPANFLASEEASPVEALLAAESRGRRLTRLPGQQPEALHSWGSMLREPEQNCLASKNHLD